MTPTKQDDALAMLRVWRQEKNMPFKSMIGATLTEEKVLNAVEKALTSGAGQWNKIPEIKGISLGSKYAGKITEQEALDLINEVIRANNQIASGDYTDITDTIDDGLELRSIDDIVTKDEV